MKAIYVFSLMIGAACIFYACTDHTINDPEVANYVGSEACVSCHQEIYNTAKESAMFNALTVAENTSPVIPMGSGDLLPPDEYNWSNLSFVIGGYEWSAAFVSTEGYVVTQKPGSQFNVADQSRVPYEPEVENGTQEFVCGECHTTGWGKVTDQLSPHFISSFPEMYFEEGVRCEVCHGPGSLHITDGSDNSVILDNSSEQCAECHRRNKDHTIISEGSFIAIGQQYEEWYSSGHREGDVGCTGCHDPHASTVNEDAMGEGVKKCNTCHTNKNADKHMAMNIKCNVCHMPKTLKIALEDNPYKGDASAHIFKINPDATYEMFSGDGLVNRDGLGLSLNYVCYQCHKDENGSGGMFSTKSMMALSQMATNFHQ